MGTSAKVTKARRLLAHNMRARREQLGVSQEKLAELSQLHRTYISSVERCQRNIGIDGIERIAKALGLPLEKLLADS
jgi:transcriptional regulator with XRE-family HTH domain